MDPDAEAELRAAHAAIWSEDELTGWPEWDAWGEDDGTGHVMWGDGDGVATVHGNCMHAHGDGAAYARYIAAADPTVMAELLAELDRLRNPPAPIAETIDLEQLAGASPQTNLVWNVMRDGKWRTLTEVADLTGIAAPSVSARLRELREPKHGFTVERTRHRGGPVYYKLSGGSDGVG